jgi:hypothetical protein
MLKHLLLLSVIFMVVKTQAQNVGIGTPNPNASALLDISSNNKGLLMPRMTSAQRNAIIAPAKGLMAFDSSQNSFWYYTGAAWKEIAGNNYNSDNALIVGQQTGTIASHNLTVNSFSTDSSGYLYDSGGPLGNYGNNENFVYAIFPISYQLATDINVLSNNLESTYDSLIISDNSGHRYVLLGSTTGSYRFFGTVGIQFKSNSSNTLSGFAIRWNGVYPGTNNNYNASQTTGWYYNPSKNYMRGGLNIDNNWSPDSSGITSFAFGYNNNAKGFSSTALGINTTAKGSYSIATGSGTTASGVISTAMGTGTTASGAFSTTIGNGTTASGSNSLAMGFKTNAIGDICTAMGSGTTASRAYSTAMGQNTYASGDISTSMGYYTKSKSFGGLAIGHYNDSTNAANSADINSLNRLFQIGNGTSDNARSNAMTVLQNGNIGIGEVNPGVPLNFASSMGDKISLFSNSGNHYGFGIQSSLLQIHSDNATSDIAFGYGKSDAFTENVRFKGNGNIGIGTSSPAYMLTVKNDIDVDNGDANAGTTANTLKFGGGNTGEAIGSNRTTATNRFGLDFYTNSINRMTITQGGNIGIGITNPTSKLDVNGPITIDQKNFGGYAGLLIKGNSPVSNYPNIGFSTQNNAATPGDIIAAGIGAAINNNTAGAEAMDLSFYTSTTGLAGLTERLRIKDNGNVGIGELNPTVPLNFANSLGNKISLWGTDANHYGMGIQSYLMQFYSADFYDDIAFGYGNSAAFTENVRMKGNGNVGIGTAAPSAKLSVNGSANNATGNWGVFSDIRIKTVTGNFTDGLNVISQINPVVFNYKENAPFKTSDDQIGIVAQELEKIAPYMVSKQAYSQFTDLREVNNQAYVFLLINAVKEQQEQIMNQQQQIASQQKENMLQKKRYEEQQQRMDALEKSLKNLSQKFN